MTMVIGCASVYKYINEYVLGVESLTRYLKISSKLIIDETDLFAVNYSIKLSIIIESNRSMSFFKKKKESVQSRHNIYFASIKECHEPIDSSIFYSDEHYTSSPSSTDADTRGFLGKGSSRSS